MLWNGEQACVQWLLLGTHGRDSGRNLQVYSRHCWETLQACLGLSFLSYFKLNLSSPALLTENSYH